MWFSLQKQGKYLAYAEIYIVSAILVAPFIPVAYWQKPQSLVYFSKLYLFLSASGV